MAPADHTNKINHFKVLNCQTEDVNDMFYVIEFEVGFESEFNEEESLFEEEGLNEDECFSEDEGLKEEEGLNEDETPKTTWNADDVEVGRTSLCRTLNFNSNVCRRLRFESEDEDKY